MHGIGEYSFSLWGAFLAITFAVEFVLNRRLWIVALAVPATGFVIFILLNDGFRGHESASVFGTIYLIGILPSLIGAGLARFIRAWIELKRGEGADSEPVEE